ncbi:MAG TPA: beta-ketoacyl-[acyl-carrier-protein] synthase family protein [Candidatus Baltobacteraceae bacterium]|jgi:3-oxoacyl-[acyl-carrier-protein] synthase II|nr:beta-ketoacyl-[acyl-carrier-protein] synthase family protein [Candidatus Baltobacteraceae bacterium]
MAKNRVVITGIGIVAPLGIGKTAFWDSLLEGRIAVDTITRFDASDFPSQIAAQVDDFDASRFMNRRRLQWTDRFSQLAVAGALLALEDAELDPRGRSDVGVYTGSALGGLAFAEEQIGVFHREGLRAVRPLLTISAFGGAAASNIAIEFGLHGPTIANANSCAAGAIAIGEAVHAIRNGTVTAAIAGGVEAPLAPLTFGAFTVARAMSTRNGDPQSASRPFDRDRDGFVMAEGSGFLVLERYEDAERRGARIYAEISGFGTSNDAFHMAAPLAGGEQVAGAMRAALDDASVMPGEIEAINAHGSSTPAGDRAELRAYEHAFGERAHRIPVCATKGQHAHALGATGAWEAAISALSILEGRIPGNANFVRADDGCEIACSTGTVDVRARTVLSNSSGFGGINAALVLQSVSS